MSIFGKSHFIHFKPEPIGQMTITDFRIGAALYCEKPKEDGMKFTCRFGVLCGVVAAGAQLTAQQPRDPTFPLISPQTAMKPSVVCGMTIFPGNSALDPKMSKTPPAGKFTLQSRTPPVCRDMSRLPPLRDLKDLPNTLPTFLGPKR